ncbi:MAG: hypothetical protein K1X94_14795, partial [Sandaracinaceae bacterium]|nr:hypothetical protein [Sandaracinaceae bacterium]
TLRGVEARVVGHLVDAPHTALDDRAWLASPGEPEAPRLGAWDDGNRGAILDAPRVSFDRRSWLLAVKGVGARAPLYGDTPAGFAHAFELGASLDDAERALLGAITRESWMGEAPYGGQGLANAENALLLSSPGLREALAPAVLCPVIAIVEVPEREVAEVFHYRRHRGPVVQEHRLVPSTVRLFHQSALALGKDVEKALEALGVRDVEGLDAFVDRYLASAVALLTVGARSARVHGHGYELLDYDDAWLDKDAFVAPDGALAFADLEALVHVEAADVATLGARVRRQVDRNAYEVLYGADALLRVEERWRDRPRDQAMRRRALADRTELALLGDPAVKLERGAEGWDLVIRPRVGEPVVVRWLDER